MYSALPPEPTRAGRWVGDGAPGRAVYSPNVMGLASLGLDIGVFGDFLYRVLLLSTILGLAFLGLTLSWPQVGYYVEAHFASDTGLKGARHYKRCIIYR